MNAENPNSAAGKDAQAAPPRKRRRGWFRRNWLWFLPTLILALIVLGAGIAYWSLFVSVYRLDVVQAAMQTIKNDKGLQEKLGQPIHKVWWPSRSAIPSARIEDREKEVRWNIHGPKGVAKVHVLAQMRVGQWQTVILDVTLPDGKKVSLEEADDTGKDAPPFQAPKPTGKAPEGKAPPDINLAVPPADAPP